MADSALYSADSLKRMSDLEWLTRVPLTLAEAKRILSQIEEGAFEESALSGYRIAQVGSNYAGIPQRWLVVESEARREAASEQLDRRLSKSEKQLQKRLDKLKKEDFECEADALRAAESFAEELRHHDLTDLHLTSELRHDKPGRPAKDAPQGVRCPCSASSVTRRLYRKRAKIRGASSWLRTMSSDMPEEEGHYTNDELLKEYKGQQSTERGFRFLKDPMFFTSSIFVKTPERVAALAMVMRLCLLVYTLGQRTLREALQAAGATMSHQTGKQTARPTLRWVFQLFQAMHLLKIGEEKRSSNLSEE